MTVTKTENDGAQWYHVSGYSAGFGREIDGEYAMLTDGRILDSDGVPMTDGDRETEMVRGAIQKEKGK